MKDLVALYGREILQSDKMAQEEKYPHHGKKSCFCHSVEVAYKSVEIARKFYKKADMSSLVVLAFWITATAAFNLYINLFADFSRLYGAFSFVVVFFIWLYLLMTGLVTGVLFISYGQNQLVSPRE